MFGLSLKTINSVFHFRKNENGKATQIERDQSALLTIPAVKEELTRLKEKYRPLIEQMDRDGLSWLERKALYKEDPSSCPTFETEWNEFRKEVCKSFQTCANAALQSSGKKPIQWEQYGTDSPFSDIDLIALTTDITVQELYLATTLMNSLVNQLFPSDPNTERTTGHLFDWETYIPHHANLVSERDFLTQEGKNAFKTLGLELAFLQIFTHAAPNEWNEIKVDIVSSVEESMKPFFKALFRDIEQFRQLQSTVDHQKMMKQCAIEGSHMQADIANIEKKLVKSTPVQIKKLEQELDQKRMQFLLYYALIESTQAGGQYSYGAYETVCKGEGGQRHKKALQEEGSRVKQAISQNGSLDKIIYHIEPINKTHAPSSHWAHLLSAIENYGFLLHEPTLVSGSKYAERIYQSLETITPSDEIKAAHRQMDQLLSIKRDEKLHTDGYEPMLHQIADAQSKRNKVLLDNIPDDSHPQVIMEYVHQAISKTYPHADKEKVDAICETIVQEMHDGMRVQEPKQILAKYFPPVFSQKTIANAAEQLSTLKNEELFIVEKADLLAAAIGTIQRAGLSYLDPDINAFIEASFAPKLKQSPEATRFREKYKKQVLSDSPKANGSLKNSFKDIFKDVLGSLVDSLKRGEIQPDRKACLLTATLQTL